jgi:hypothetical protein
LGKVFPLANIGFANLVLVLRVVRGKFRYVINSQGGLKIKV